MLLKIDILVTLLKDVCNKKDNFNECGDQNETKCFSDSTARGKYFID